MGPTGAYRDTGRPLEINMSSMWDTPYPIHNAVRSRNFGLLPRLPSGSHCDRIMLGSRIVLGRQRLIKKRVEIPSAADQTKTNYNQTHMPPERK